MSAIGKLVLGIAVAASAMTANAVVIYQVYGGGGNTGAQYTNDFVVLFNEDQSSINLDPWSLQYASATGTGNFGGNPVLDLPNFLLAPGQYFLVQAASGGASGVALPTADALWTANMSATAGKVALVQSTAGLACNGGSTPCSAAQLALLEDLVGYGNANFFEGAGAAPTLSNTTVAFRMNDGCTDTNNNSADFTVGAPAPRNSSSPFNVCAAPPNGAPEPGTLALLGLGLAGLAAARRRR